MRNGGLTRIPKLLALASLLVVCAVPLTGLSQASAANVPNSYPHAEGQCSVSGLAGANPGSSVNVAPGAAVTITCSSLVPNNGIEVAEASPVDGSLLSDGLDSSDAAVLPTDAKGNVAGTFTVPRNFVAPDPTASCPPSQYQLARGSGDCAIVLFQYEGFPELSYLGTITVDYPTTPPPGWTAIAAPSDGSGYWLVNGDGVVHPHGAVKGYGDLSNLRLNAPVVGIASTTDGKGYWLVAQDGGVFAFGDARFMGSTGALRLNSPVDGMAATADGNGYWLVASDGGVFSFGDARFRGSAVSKYVQNPIVGLVADPSSGGYWLVDSGGNVNDFTGTGNGDCPQAPETYGRTWYRDPVVRGLVGVGAEGGFRYVGTDGSVVACGGAPSFGSMKGTTLNAPVIGAALDRATDGYWLLGADGGVFSFHAPFYGAG